MLIQRGVLDRLAAGRLDLAFRRWPRARVKAGTLLRTAIGLVEVVSVEVVAMNTIAARDARRAGYPSTAELLDELRRREGRVHRIRLRARGADPRRALADKDQLDDADVATLRTRLERMDARSPSGPWTSRTLRMIRRRPATRAGDLAGRMGMEQRRFKANVRKLKELGLTESLEIGYRLSARGQAFLAS